jgi:UDP-glucose 4-epimerase
VVIHAVRNGWRVRSLARHSPDPKLLPAEVETLLGDLRDAHVRRRALSGADCVLHLAATLHVTAPDLQSRTDYDSLNVAATAALARDAALAGVRRLVLFSTISVYGDTRGQTATEKTPPSPRTPYARSKRAGEEAVLQARTADGAQIGTVLRLGAVYGPRIKGNYWTLLERLASGGTLPILPGSNRRTVVFVEDVARAALVAAEDWRAAGQTFNVTDGAVHTLTEIVAEMCEALGRPVPRIGIPATVARAIVDTCRPILRGPFARVPPLVDKYVEDVAVSGSALQCELGFVPAVGLKEGWRRTVAEAVTRR